MADDHQCNRAERYPVSDCHSIFCFFACSDACENHKKQAFRPEIFTGYTPDEPIEPEEDIDGFTPVDVEPW